MADIRIPDEAVEAAARAICAHIGSNWVFNGDPRHSEAREDMMAQGRAALAAGLAAWEAVKGGFMDEVGNVKPAIILPLQQEGDP